VGSMRVLVVDDNSTNRRILQEILHNWGLDPLLASSVDEGWRTLVHADAAGSPCRLVLLDSHIPGRSGLELAAMMREDPRFSDVAIILITSGYTADEARRCKELDIDGFIAKPVLQSDLMDRIVSIERLHRGSVPDTVASAAEALPPLKVLLTEDNRINQRLATRMLEKQGHDVHIANNGQEALDALERGPFDVVFMDVQMPVMGGFEATRRMRERERTTGDRTPIIAMTAHAMKGDRERCLDAGMDDYVSKPVRLQDLRLVLERVFAKHMAAG